MKRIYLFGRATRIIFLLSFAFAIWAFIDICIRSSFHYANLSLLLFVMVVAGFWLIRMYSLGFFLDKKKDTLKIVLRFSRKGTRERALSGVESIDVRLNGNIGMTFTINYKPNYKEEVEYRFYRLALLEKIQYKRIKEQLDKINTSIANGDL